jgi:hypothetical protein
MPKTKNSFEAHQDTELVCPTAGKDSELNQPLKTEPQTQTLNQDTYAPIQSKILKRQRIVPRQDKYSGELTFEIFCQTFVIPAQKQAQTQEQKHSARQQRRSIEVLVLQRLCLCLCLCLCVHIFTYAYKEQ